MGRIKLDTINDFARQGYLAGITCKKCGKVCDWKPAALIQELHRRGSPRAVEEVESRLRCSTCGAREASQQPALDRD